MESLAGFPVTASPTPTGPTTSPTERRFLASPSTLSTTSSGSTPAATSLQIMSRFVGSTNYLPSALSFTLDTNIWNDISMLMAYLSTLLTHVTHASTVHVIGVTT